MGAAVTGSHDILPEFRVEGSDHLIEVGQSVSEDHGDRQGRRAIDLDHGATRQLFAGDHAVQFRFRVADDLVILGRLAESNLEGGSGGVEGDVVRAHVFQNTTRDLNFVF